MGRAKKSWRQKLAGAKAKGLPRVFLCDRTKRRLVIPSPEELERIIRGIPRGKLTTMADMGQRLRVAHGVDAACPITTGIFTWLIAHAADEAAAEGRKRVPPWWRVLKTGGLLNPKYPGGGQTQQGKLEAEGHKILRKGKSLRVADYERALVPPS